MSNNARSGNANLWAGASDSQHSPHFLSSSLPMHRPADADDDFDDEEGGIQAASGKPKSAKDDEGDAAGSVPRVEATAVEPVEEAKVCSAVPVSPTRWERHKRSIIATFAILVVALVAVIVLLAIQRGSGDSGPTEDHPIASTTKTSIGPTEPPPAGPATTPPAGRSIALSKSNNWSKTGNRRACAWDRCASAGFNWHKSAPCRCSGGLNTCYMEGPKVAVTHFETADLSPVVGFDPSSPIYRIGSGTDPALGSGGDCASGGECFDDPLRGGFRIDLEGSGYEFAGGTVRVGGWSPRMRVKFDGAVSRVGGGGRKTYDVEVPSGTSIIEVNCGGWCGACSSELLVRPLL